jgi:hypothetical protein
MNEKDVKNPANQGERSDTEPTILVNEYGQAADPTVVIDEADRTVLLTENETIVIEKEHMIDIPPKNRPRKVYTGMWGTTELATAGAAMLAVVAAVMLYVFFVVPSNREVENNRLRLANLEKEMIDARDKYGKFSDTKTAVAQLLESVNDFESRSLPIAANGRTALYQRINGLIASYGLVNTTGPDYAPLEIADTRKGVQTDDERGKSKFQSLFPGVYVSATVEGPYVNLRRFIQAIETGNEFVVISAIELEPSESEQKTGQQGDPVQAGPVGGIDPTTRGMPATGTSGTFQPAAQAALPKSERGKTHGETVRLRLEMAAYFRRPNTIPPTAEVVPQ